MKFLKICLSYLAITAISGLLCGLLYSKGVIGDTGLWVDTLNWLTKVTLDKVSFSFEFFGALYLVAWAYISKLATVHTWSKWLLIKCCLGFTSVPVFIIFAGFFIAPLTPAQGPALYVSLMGYILGYAWYVFLV